MEREIYRKMAEIEDVHWWFTARRGILDRAISKMALPSPARVLEAGCGTGGNLPMLARHGQVYGMESDEAAREFAASRKCGPVEPGLLPDQIPFPEIAFDLIVIADVLEHLDDEVRSLEALRKRLSAHGRLLIAVPAFPWLWSGHDIAHHHRRRYVAPYLKEKVTAAGFHVDYVSYFNSILFPAAVAARLARRVFVGRDNGHDLRMPPRPLNTALTAIFGAERHLIGKVSLPAGVSLLMVASN